MSKKCNSCGFQQNPDTSHYCGKCGKQLSYSDNYKLYNASLQTPVYNSTLNNYKKYEKQVNSSWLFNTGNKIKEWWNKSGKENILVFIGSILFAGVLIGVFSLFSKSCSSDNKIARIKLNGKYGIGYNEDKMLVPATFDSISPSGIGNQWILYDKQNEYRGIAYVTDSITKIITPQTAMALQIDRNDNGLSILRLNDSTNKYLNIYKIATKGQFVNNNIYSRIAHPSGNWKENECIVASNTDGGMEMLGEDGLPINGKTYFNIVVDPDSMIRAIGFSKTKKSNSYGTTTIHNYSGKQTSPSEFYGVNAFSDGVAWVNLTEQDRKNSSHSVIDRNGEVLFKNKRGAVRCIGFGDGVG